VALTVFSPFTKMAPSWITSTFLFFSLILFQKDFSPFSNLVKQEPSGLSVQ